MISVIICSIKPELLKAIRQNIALTIGVDHEVIAHDNRKDSFGICKVYNLCAEKAKFDYLCFVHEDVSFRIKDWGKELIGNTHEDTGIIGLAGGLIKTQYPTSWSDSDKKYNRANIYHNADNQIKHDYINPDGEAFSRVLLLDGVFLFTRKSIWENVRFDEVNFKGFHLYDQDFSFRVARTFKNFVCNTIELEHYSRGYFSLDWFAQAEQFVRIWKNVLPHSVVDLSDKEWRKANEFALYSSIKRYLIPNNAPFHQISSYLAIFLREFGVTKLAWKLFFKCMRIIIPIRNR